MMKNYDKPTKMPRVSWRDRRRVKVRGAASCILERSYIPDQNVTFLLNHNKVHPAVLVLTHERVWDQMEEHIG